MTARRRRRLPVGPDDVRAAAALLQGSVARTPTIASPALSALAGTAVVLKLETLHPTGSFKERGAFVKLASLGRAERKAGVIAMSAGNHAQGVAYHARRLGIPVTIVMPAGTPFNKVTRTESLGAKVVLSGAGITEARKAALEIAAAKRLTFVHPYDDPLLIAGQGTCGLEMLADVPELDVLLVPIGGGGLISGIAVAAKAMKPGIAVIGVEVAGYAGMRHALGRGPRPAGGETLAEGIAVKEPGRITAAITRALVDDILVVKEDAVERAVTSFIESQRLVVEGAGAVGLAALLAEPRRFRRKTVGLVVTGGNIDARMLSSILMRGLVRTGRLVRLRAEITDQPGTLARLTRVIGDEGGNIVEIYHQRLFQDVPVKRAEIDIVVETRNRAHVGALVAAMTEAGYPTRLLSSTALDGEA
jgi:threonine dehydratase